MIEKHETFVDMGNGMDKILPALYLGNFRDSKDKEQLTENNITHIVSAHDNAKPLLQGYEYLCINVADSPCEDLTPYFEKAAFFIHKARCEGGNVLVHCLAGISRSTTIATAYIMAVTNMEWTEVLKSIKCCRSVAAPNPGFKRQLIEFGRSEELKMLRRRIKQEYASHIFEDESYLHGVLRNMAETQAEKLQQYEEEINVAAKYCVTNTSTTFSGKVKSTPD